MISRRNMAAHLAELVGGGLLQVTDAGTGWPSLGVLTVDGTPLPVSLFLGAVGLSHRGRDDVERRFQNPGQDRPIVPVPGRHSLLIGIIEDDQLLDVPRPLLVQADPFRRADHTTRFSVFVGLQALREAWATGWSEETSTSGELIRCLVPSLLPVSVSAALSGAEPSAGVMQAVISSSGLMDPATGESPAAERARRAGSSLVRDARFRRRVASAYGGRCAMCGIGAGLIQAAHIYPAAAPGSQDEPWNGLALCPNHHAAFDQHLIAVRPQMAEVLFSPELRACASSSPPVTAFVASTYRRLAPPADPAARPNGQMFMRRYEYFGGYYGWLPSV